LASGPSEPSIITLVKPCWIAVAQVASLFPWSWCMQIGMRGCSSASPSIRCFRTMSLAYWRAPRLAWMMTGASQACAASRIASPCSMLLMLNAGTP
jgi:hypothetical protein